MSQCILLSFLLIIILHLTFFPDSVLSSTETDLQSLLAFKSQITDDPFGVLTSWNQSSSDFCQWSGVTCSRRYQRVVELDLSSSQLRGSLSFHVGSLSFLRTLDLQNNSFTGNIPDQVGHLFRLRNLFLNSNSFSGVIPSNLSRCSNLVSIVLGGNDLTGEIPEQLGVLSKLELLSLERNSLGGEIPSSLAGCVSLQELDLSRNFFQGTISSSLGAMEAIRYINVSNNNLTGKIPSFLGDFKLLESLDLSFNGFEGEVPVNGVFANVSKISIIRNKNLCGGIPELNLPKCSFIDQSNDQSKRSESSNKSLLMIVTIVSGCLGLIFLICFLLFCYFRKPRTEPAVHSDFSFEKCMLRLTYRDLHQATNGFHSSNLIGAGSFGSVYKGILQHNGMVVAVKVLNRLHEGTYRSFVAECKAWTYIRHRNLVQILTACSSIDFRGRDFKALVYEFMINGSLDEWLHHVHHRSDRRVHQPRRLNLLERLNIAVDVASALDYLHNHRQVPIIHCELKPSNVLLDGDMNAHVGDFGISRFLQETPNVSSQKQRRSSNGYAAPEYGKGSKVSTYGDVYSFGILLLEMFTGKRPTDNMFKDGMNNLHTFAESGLNNRVQDIMDPTLVEEHREANLGASDTRNRFETHKYMECVISVLKVGVACSAEVPSDRMDISTASAEVHRIRGVLYRMESLM